MLEKYGFVDATTRYPQFKNSVIWEGGTDLEPMIYVIQASGYIRKPKRIDSPRGGYTWNMNGHISLTFPAGLPNWKEVGNRLLLLLFQERNGDISKDEAIDVKYNLKVIPNMPLMIRTVFTRYEDTIRKIAKEAEKGLDTREKMVRFFAKFLD